ncbi:hypothetical protein ZHAS_00008869 [Anopheles sinensis]|uniref:Uncharacterized protein n=1 Tax=Anopheles sinensis TaxID=74873 RepID=A0A084VTI3_ANOSI|nr:hypothetical protein ZHAS_00008869 [Anopheles sinensis]
MAFPAQWMPRESAHMGICCTTIIIIIIARRQQYVYENHQRLTTAIPKHMPLDTLGTRTSSVGSQTVRLLHASRHYHCKQVARSKPDHDTIPQGVYAHESHRTFNAGFGQLSTGRRSGKLSQDVATFPKPAYGTCYRLLPYLPFIGRTIDGCLVDGWL